VLELGRRDDPTALGGQDDLILRSLSAGLQALPPPKYSDNSCPGAVTTTAAHVGTFRLAGRSSPDEIVPGHGATTSLGGRLSSLGATVRWVTMGGEVILGAIRLVFRAELHRRWKSWLALAALIALVAGTVLAAAAAGRRTATALPRFVAAHGFDFLVYNTKPVPGIARLPEVTSATYLPSLATDQPTCACSHVINSTNFSVFVPSPTALARVVKLVSGRLPNQSASNEVVASFNLQRDNGVHVGTVIQVPFFSSSQEAALNTALLGSGHFPAPAGRRMALRVVGIGAAEFEIAPGTSPSFDLYGTQALGPAVGQRTPMFSQYLVRLRHGAADIGRFRSDVSAFKVVGTQNQDGPANAVATSIHPQAVGWWVLAVLAGLAALAVIGQGLGRQSSVESEEYPTLTALGLVPRQFAVLGMARNLAVALAGAVGAVALAFALSPLTPVGEARLAEPFTGFAFDLLVLPLGALATVVGVLVLGVWPAVRASRASAGEEGVSDAHPSALVASLAAAGAPPSAVIGVRHALVRGRGRARVPVGTALFGTAMAVLALCGTAVFGTSLSHLTASPELYGDAFHVWFCCSGPANTPFSFPLDPLVTTLEQDKAITRVTLGIENQVEINKVSVDTIAGTGVRGPLLMSKVDGRLPNGDGQVALGVTTMRQVGAQMGSVVQVTVRTLNGGTRTAAFRVVGRTSFPVDFGIGGLGTGALFTIGGYLNAVCPPGPARSACRTAVDANQQHAVLARAIPGPKGRAAITHYVKTYQFAQRPIIPTSLVNFGEAVNFPLILGLMLAVFGAATMLHLLVVSVARRQREIGLLRALGFVNRQVGAAVCWQATTVALVGIIVGVPLGVAAGQLAWKAFATNLGVVPVSVVSVGLIAALGAGVLVVANVLALAPALVAARSHSAHLLRAQ
jgi:hypothetical protein